MRWNFKQKYNDPQSFHFNRIILASLLKIDGGNRMQARNLLQESRGKGDGDQNGKR